MLHSEVIDRLHSAFKLTILFCTNIVAMSKSRHPLVGVATLFLTSIQPYHNCFSNIFYDFNTAFKNIYLYHKQNMILVGDRLEKLT